MQNSCPRLIWIWRWIQLRVLQGEYSWWEIRVGKLKSAPSTVYDYVPWVMVFHYFTWLSLVLFSLLFLYLLCNSMADYFGSIYSISKSLLSQAYLNYLSNSMFLWVICTFMLPHQIDLVCFCMLAFFAMFCFISYCVLLFVCFIPFCFCFTFFCFMFVFYLVLPFCLYFQRTVLIIRSLALLFQIRSI